jgi:hypothetical protein
MIRPSSNIRGDGISDEVLFRREFWAGVERSSQEERRSLWQFTTSVNPVWRLLPFRVVFGSEIHGQDSARTAGYRMFVQQRQLRRGRLKAG